VGNYCLIIVRVDIEPGRWRTDAGDLARYWELARQGQPLERIAPLE
jgi:hypothetical protein